jgi:hypothetical protein
VNSKVALDEATVPDGPPVIVTVGGAAVAAATTTRAPAIATAGSASRPGT